MADDIRTERTLAVTIPRLTPEQVHTLAQLRLSAGWPVFLDVMERFCIELDTQLVNTPVGDDAGIIARHTKTQVAWQMFEYLQRHILDAAQLDREVYDEQRPSPLTPAQAEIEELINPIRRDP